MPAPTKMDRVVTLPADYQKNGGDPLDDSELEQEVSLAAEVEDVESLPILSVDDWLGDDVAPITKWIALKSRAGRIQIRGVTEQERLEINKRVPKRIDKRTRRPMPDEESAQLELIKAAIVQPELTSAQQLKRALSGEIAYIAEQVAQLSGFDFNLSDALG